MLDDPGHAVQVSGHDAVDRQWVDVGAGHDERQPRLLQRHDQLTIDDAADENQAAHVGRAGIELRLAGSMRVRCNRTVKPCCSRIGWAPAWIEPSMPLLAKHFRFAHHVIDAHQQQDRFGGLRRARRRLGSRSRGTQPPAGQPSASLHPHMGSHSGRVKPSRRRRSLVGRSGGPWGAWQPHRESTAGVFVAETNIALFQQQVNRLP